MKAVVDNKPGTRSVDPTAFQAELADYLYLKSSGAQLVSACIAIMMALMLWGSSQPAAVLVWLVAVELVYFGRIWLASVYRKASDRDAARWLFRFRLGALLTGLAWGSGGILLFPDGDITGQALLTMTVAGIAAGGAIAYVVDTYTLTAFVLPLALPLTLHHFAEGYPQSATMGSMMVLFIGYVLLGARRNARDIQESIRLRLSAVENEQTIREQNEFLQTVLESEPECVKLIAPDGRLLQMNRAGLAMLEVESVDEANWFGLLNFVVPADRAAFADTLTRVMQGETVQLEFQVEGKNGTHRTLETHAAPLRDAGGRVKALLGITRDVTGRKQAEEEYRSIIQTTGEGFWMVSVHEGRLLDVNLAYCVMSGYSREELLAMRIIDLEAMHDEARIRRNLQLLMQGQPLVFESQHQRKDGSRFDVEVSARFLDVRGGIIVVFLRDISERKKAELDLRLAATAFESQEGIIITDADNNILRVNSAFCTVTGYQPEEVIGKNPRLLKSGRQDAAFYEMMWHSLINRDAWEGEIWNRRKNGEVYPERLSITVIRDAAGQIVNYVATLFDITESKAAEEEIRHLAFYDPLTHLANRRLLLERVKQAMVSCGRSGKLGALMLIDLDNFKDLNDTLGHDKGDLLLQQVARRLESSVREEDTVARLGGDEFVVMLEQLSGEPLEAAAQAEAICEKILEMLGRPYQLDTHAFQCTASIGATLFTSGLQSTEEMIKQADIALYQSKHAGRNTLRFFDPQMQAAINARAEIERELRRALDQRQFLLYCQAQVDHSGKPFGAEVLVRWAHPQQGVLSPARFIHLAEDTGLILPIGQWVLNEACAQLKRWQDDARLRDLVLAVNVSGRQFRLADFVEQVRAAILRHGVRPMHLKLELTESVVLEDIEDTIEKMVRLKEFGVQISLDDFGTGYSSLSYLKRLPLDQIKIDQSFVRDITFDQGDVVLVRTIIDLAMNFGLDVIAEGVETAEQFRLLQRYGCSGYQGYLFSKPLPVAEFAASVMQG